MKKCKYKERKKKTNLPRAPSLQKGQKVEVRRWGTKLMIKYVNYKWKNCINKEKMPIERWKEAE